MEPRVFRSKSLGASIFVHDEATISQLPDDAEEVLGDELNQLLPKAAINGIQYDVDAIRQSAYTEKVDPLISESLIKRAMGLTDEADALMQQAIVARSEIKSLYPKTE